MKTITKLALSAPILLALSACEAAEETETLEAETQIGAEEPEIPLDSIEEAREDEAMGVQPLADETLDGEMDAEEPAIEEGM